MRAKKVNEWAGAGFSYGSSYPNRGGRGFGGANNLGGPNMMYTYEIKPLNRYLEPKQSEVNDIEKVHDGHYIEGKKLNSGSKKLYRGTIIKTEKNDRGSVNYFVILCDDNHQKMKIDPTSVVLLSGQYYVDSKNEPLGLDKPDLKRNQINNIK